MTLTGFPKKSLKRRANKEVPDASVNKMQAPPLPLPILGERINALNVSRVLHKTFKHEILEVKNHRQRTIAVFFRKVETANVIINHSILKENNLPLFPRSEYERT